MSDRAPRTDEPGPAGTTPGAHPGGGTPGAVRVSTWPMWALGLVLLVGVPLLVSGLWGWLLWTLRRRERVAQN